MPEEEKAEQVVQEDPDKLKGKAGDEERQEPTKERLIFFSIAALGVVYGDIGTSPLYALRKCFYGQDAVPVTTGNILGVLSLILWSLIIVISVKYIAYIMRASNEGEGGILALMSLVAPHQKRSGRWFVLSLGIFGAALLYGDGMITPAISVMSAVEGLRVATPAFHNYILPITTFILVLLFIFQKRGTAGIGKVFGPVMLVWFLTIGVLGAANLVRNLEVLTAVFPTHAVRFFLSNGYAGFVVLGGVFLTVTGGEALYADMGHFGRKPIRLAWFGLVIIALVFNYFGQGALMMSDPAHASQPFYLLAPSWALYPLVGLAVVATIIASQAVISAAFSLTRQAVLLGDFPNMRIFYTSRERMGQVYMPAVNWIMMFATIGLVLGFKHSSNLAGAYGVAVSTTMIITTALAYVVARERWKWKKPVALLVTAAFLCVDIPFFAANILKIPQGGWFPIVIALGAFIIMHSWRKGRELIDSRSLDAAEPLESYLAQLKGKGLFRVSGMAVFITEHEEGTPALLRHHVELNKSLHEHVVLLTVHIEDTPYVYGLKRVQTYHYDSGFIRMIARFGYMERPDVPAALRQYTTKLDMKLDEVTYYIGQQSLFPSKEKAGLPFWMERLFAFLARNSARPIALYQIPADRVYEADLRVEL